MLLKIEGHPISRQDVIKINKVIEDIWQSANTDEVDLDHFNTHAYGPDCIEMTISGENWVVFDMRSDDCMICRHDGFVNVASKELFALCSELSPEDRITWHKNPEDLWFKV